MLNLKNKEGKKLDLFTIKEVFTRSIVQEEDYSTLTAKNSHATSPTKKIEVSPAAPGHWSNISDSS